MDTDQITRLFFHSQKQGRRIAQRRLAKLVESNRLKRDRLSLYMPYYYYLDKKPKLVDHTLATNWAYVWAKGKLSRDDSLLCFSTEDKYNILRPDAFIGISRGSTNLFFFVEVDLSNNLFDKVEKYNKLFFDKGYVDKWWASVASGFPSIVIFTHRVSVVKYKIATENIHKLDFQVYDIADIRNIK